MNAPHMVGVKPESGEIGGLSYVDQPSYPIVHCKHCGAPTVVAFDGRADEAELSPLHERHIDFAPVPEDVRYLGDVVLWFLVDGSKAVGRQRFTRIRDVEPSYAGQVWRYHRLSCGRRQLDLEGVR